MVAAVDVAACENLRRGTVFYHLLNTPCNNGVEYGGTGACGSGRRVTSELLKVYGSVSGAAAVIQYDIRDFVQLLSAGMAGCCR